MYTCKAGSQAELELELVPNVVFGRLCTNMRFWSDVSANVTDISSKPLSATVFERHRDALGLIQTC